MPATTYNTLIQGQELVANLSQSNLVVIDCSHSLAQPEFGRQQYLKQHIPGAKYAHLDDDLAAVVSATSGRHPLPVVADLLEHLRFWGVSSNTQVVVYDLTAGSIAVRLWWMLRWLGHHNVALLDGGLMRWIELGLPLEHEVQSVPRGDFSAHADDHMWVDVQTLTKQLQRGLCLLLDARSSERFVGLQEPIDKAAGHIAAAVNLPYEGNLDPHGQYLGPAQLKQRFTPLLAQHTPAQIIHMCGSGVTACHNLLAMEIAGLQGSLLYPGSWSEWISDPRRTIINDSIEKC